MAVARSAVRSPWRLSRKVSTSACIHQQSLPGNILDGKFVDVRWSPALKLPEQKRSYSHTSTVRQDPKVSNDSEQTTKGETENASNGLITPKQEVNALIEHVQDVHRPQDQIKLDIISLAKYRGIKLPENFEDPTQDSSQRLPRNVQALFLAPMRRQPKHGIPTCNLQLRSYSVRNLEHMADFAMRAAYYLDLPAKGPIPLPRIVNRWTVPRSNFIFTKRPENFERVTVRRLIQIQDGHPEVVQRWLLFLRKHMWYGVGYKANLFEFEGMEVVKRMDQNADAVEEGLQSVDWELFGRRKGLSSEEDISKVLDQLGFGSDKPAATAVPASASQSTATPSDSPATSQPRKNAQQKDKKAKSNS